MDTLSSRDDEDVGSALVASLYWPGLAQALQRRFFAAVFFSSGPVALVIWGATSQHMILGWLAAALVALWAIIDAFRWARGGGRSREREIAEN